MIIKRISPISGETNVWDIPCTPEQLHAYNEGELIQRAMPNLTDNQREFIISGITPDEWDVLYPKEDEENDPKYWYNEPAF